MSGIHVGRHQTRSVSSVTEVGYSTISQSNSSVRSVTHEGSNRETRKCLAACHGDRFGRSKALGPFHADKYST